MMSRGCLTETPIKELIVHHSVKIHITCMMERKQILTDQHHYGNIKTKVHSGETQWTFLYGTGPL